ncbi:MAG: branched-chain amino acid ABC transporter permease [Pseudomonadota bacterium]
MDYLIFSLSVLLVYVGLAQMLHIQFGLLGIPNFGVVGFWGLGMYAMAVFQVQLDLSFIDGLALTMVLMIGVSALFAKAISRMEGQAILCATIAFGAIVALLVVTEKWITMGVVGLGTVRYPVRLGDSGELLYFAFLLSLVVLTQVFIARLHQAPAGRLLTAIRDNEELAASLGKDTSRVKFIWFTITATLMGLLGALSAPLNQFLTPNMLVASVTFAVWIALVLGGKESSLGAILGVFLTFGLFDILIETYLPVSPELAVVVPNAKLFIYGLVLVGVLLYMPSGVMRKNSPLEGQALRALRDSGQRMSAPARGIASNLPGLDDLRAGLHRFVTGTPSGRPDTKTSKPSDDDDDAASKPNAAPREETS